MLCLFVAARKRWIMISTKILDDKNFVVKATSAVLILWVVEANWCYNNLQSRNTAKLSLSDKRTISPRHVGVFQRGFPPECPLLANSFLHHWCSAPPSPRAPPRRPMPPRPTWTRLNGHSTGDSHQYPCPLVTGRTPKGDPAERGRHQSCRSLGASWAADLQPGKDGIRWERLQSSWCWWWTRCSGWWFGLWLQSIFFRLSLIIFLIKDCWCH